MGEAVVMCDAIVTDNYATENALIALGVKDSAIIRVPWGPDTTHLSSLTRAEADWPDDRKILLYPRSVESHYQPDIFVTALAQIVHEVPEVLAVMVEAGSMVQEIKGLLSTAGLDDYVRWEPPSTPDYFQGLLGLADCVVVTPKTDGTSVTVMDAMNQGIPVVSSLTAGSAQWIIHGITGWSFPAGDAVKLAHVVVEVLTADTHRIEAITRNAKRLVGSRAGWQASSAQLRQVLASLLGRVSP
jgi:glycosyltransferase involved in cell wall biosynthesis